ncbi:hypothetical protein OG883_31025 [Streptomyces sp. NBC_01142]|uniref:hypothetical protein n=1 Tax=Streptomyces sp. NBC_01142 TaxID=2975865 RepID=UPI0022543A80|nr:hypothetical protein [Streptomyces sp. NBC_01142]MCX4824213.1 hypothetical protein [Streptomyces sp. NBC_01142]
MGLAAGVLGLLCNNDDLWRVGLFVVITATPLIIIRTVHTSQHATAHQLAEADNAGYRRALEHVARGLLDAPAGPTPGKRNRAEQAAGNVIPLRPQHLRQAERKAQ